MGEEADRQAIFNSLEEGLTAKGIPREEIDRAKDDIRKYIESLEREMSFAATVGLKDFAFARR